MILVADVGGTHTRLALAEPSPPTCRLLEVRVFGTIADIGSLVRQYLAEVRAPQVETFACAGAGPVGSDGSIRLTNSATRLEPAALAAAAGVTHAILMNDFEAVAQALPALTGEDLRPCGGGPADPHGVRLALGPGTGLGVAALITQGSDWQALAGEAGHSDLAPVDDEELLVWERLRADLGRLSAERVLSGPGLEHLYRALSLGRRLPAPEIAQAVANDAVAAQAVRVFTRWLGRVAGNLALAYGARGGVYLAGGIVPAWGETFDTAEFRRGFEDKAPMAAYLRAIPSYVVTHPQPGLLGLARRAVQLS